jgi:hypothetical protein
MRDFDAVDVNELLRRRSARLASYGSFRES